MIWLFLALGIVVMYVLGKWTCLLGHHWEHVSYTDEPWLHYYKCKRCPSEYQYSPWDECGYR